KYTGTLGQIHHRTDQLAATILAFAHFVLENTACHYMFADIQGMFSCSYDRNELGQTTLVLFDPMSHTPTKSSGLGDHGVDGIRDFIQSHQCNTICALLKLASPDVLQASLD
ncbi:hypothetical protein JAAARDRAFT_91717, partial [Jaapia argillacea MUCL 33604]